MRGGAGFLENPINIIMFIVIVLIFIIFIYYIYIWYINNKKLIINTDLSGNKLKSSSFTNSIIPSLTTKEHIHKESMHNFFHY